MNDYDQLHDDAMLMAMSLYLRDDIAPDVAEVMERWKPLVEAEIARICNGEESCAA